MSAATSNIEDKKFSNILVAIDGSEHSLRAAEYALGLAKTFEAKLTAVTVCSCL
jgi:nucleotide-binding universal stress UspA family protein